MGKTSFIDIKSILIATFIFFLVSIKKINAILVIVIAGILGIILY